MKKFIIVGYDIRSVYPGKQKGEPNVYFELGWELIKTRLALISLIKENIIDPNEVYIVTPSDRKFLYTKFCKNVICYNEFINLIDTNSQVYDLVQDMTEWVSTCHVWKEANTFTSNLWQSKINPLSYKYTKEEAPQIIQFDVPNTVISDPFVCMVIRKREHVAQRGMNDDQIKQCFNIFKEKQLKTYIMGHDAEQYTDNENIIHISLQQMTALINDKKCKALITPLSGGGMIRLFTGICPMITFDLQNHRPGNETNPLFWGDQMIFSDLNKNNWKLVNQFDASVLKNI
jgi:hypothetical protein